MTKDVLNDTKGTTFGLHFVSSSEIVGKFQTRIKNPKTVDTYKVWNLVIKFNEDQTTDNTNYPYGILKFIN